MELHQLGKSVIQILSFQYVPVLLRKGKKKTNQPNKRNKDKMWARLFIPQFLKDGLNY